MLEISVTPATGHLLVQLEVQGLSKLPLLLVKAIEVIHRHRVLEQGVIAGHDRDAAVGDEEMCIRDSIRSTSAL